MHLLMIATLVVLGGCVAAVFDLYRQHRVLERNIEDIAADLEELLTILGITTGSAASESDHNHHQ